MIEWNWRFVKDRPAGSEVIRDLSCPPHEERLGRRRR
jgi:hypothetical protein